MPQLSPDRVRRLFSIHPGHTAPGTEDKGTPPGGSIDVDLPRNEARHVPLTIRYLGSRRVLLRVSALGPHRERVELSWQLPSPRAAEQEQRLREHLEATDNASGLEVLDRVLDGAPPRLALLPVAGSSPALENGESQTLWVKVSGEGVTSSRDTLQLRIPLQLSIQRPETDDTGSTRLIDIDLRIWPVEPSRPGTLPFDVVGTDISTDFWAAAVEPGDPQIPIDEFLGARGLEKMELLARHHRDVGGSVMMDNTAGSTRFLGVLREAMPTLDLDAVRAARGTTLDDLSEAELERILGTLPRIDFGRFLPWHLLFFRIGYRHAMLSVSPHVSRRRSLVNALTGLGETTDHETLAEKILLVWLYRAYRQHLRSLIRLFAGSLGFRTFTAKVGDEPGTVEELEGYRHAVEIVRRAGWRVLMNPLPTFTRHAAGIQAVAPLIDTWAIDAPFLDAFRSFDGLRLESREHEASGLAGAWNAYGNGGAEHTWSRQLFTPDDPNSAVPFGAHEIHRVRAWIRPEGRPRREITVRYASAWGNTATDVLYLDPLSGPNVWVGLPDGESLVRPLPPGKIAVDLELQLFQHVPSDRGEVLFRLDESHEVWCEAGGRNPYSKSYAWGWSQPVFALIQRCQGWNFFAFFRYENNPGNIVSRIVWVLPEGNGFRAEVSPAWCGQRDGAADTQLFQRVQSIQSSALDSIVGRDRDATVRVEPEDTPDPSAGPPAVPTTIPEPDLEHINTARRQALEFLARNEGL